MADSYDQFLAMAGTMTRETWPDLINKAIDVIWEQANEAPDLKLGAFFDKVNMTAGRTHVVSSVTSHLPLPSESEDLDPLRYLVAAPGRDKTFTVVNYRSAVRATDTAFRMDRFDKILYAVSGLLQSAYRFDEYQYAAILNNAFTGTDGDDDLSLCHDSHPLENRDRGTYDNKGTGALSGPNLHVLRLLLRKMPDPQGDPMPNNGPYTLVIADEDEQTAIELIKTDKKPDTALNNTNALLPEITYMTSPYLSSSVQYYLFGNAVGEARGLHEVSLMDWDLSDNSPANVDIKIDRRIKGIKTFGFTHTKNMAGSTGA